MWIVLFAQVGAAHRNHYTHVNSRKSGFHTFLKHRNGSRGSAQTPEQHRQHFTALSNCLHSAQPRVLPLMEKEESLMDFLTVCPTALFWIPEIPFPSLDPRNPTGLEQFLLSPNHSGTGAARSQSCAPAGWKLCTHQGSSESQTGLG